MMTHLINCQQEHKDRRHEVARRALPAAGGFFFGYEYAYFGAYFFVSSRAERRAET